MIISCSTDAIEEEITNPEIEAPTEYTSKVQYDSPYPSKQVFTLYDYYIDSNNDTMYHYSGNEYSGGNVEKYILTLDSHYGIVLEEIPRPNPISGSSYKPKTYDFTEDCETFLKIAEVTNTDVNIVFKPKYNNGRNIIGGSYIVTLQEPIPNMENPYIKYKVELMGTDVIIESTITGLTSLNLTTKSPNF